MKLRRRKRVAARRRRDHGRASLFKSCARLCAQIRATPRRAGARLALGKSGQLNPAVARFREALHEPDYLGLRSNLGVALEQKGDLEGALEAFGAVVN